MFFWNMTPLSNYLHAVDNDYMCVVHALRISYSGLVGKKYQHTVSVAVC
jgi:hypothetical protein